MVHSSDLLAAFLAAYEADRRWFEEHKGIELTPAEFAKRHRSVLMTRLSNGQFAIQMGPEAVMKGPRGVPQIINRGQRYIVGGETFNVVDQFFDS